MDKADLGAIGEFLDRYRHFTESLHSRCFDQFCTEFCRLQVGLEAVLAQTVVERRRTASTFNIFQVLDRTYDEVGTHSRLLVILRAILRIGLRECVIHVCSR